MFDRFTERARKVMSLARLEAQRFYHDYVGTEHILLALVKEGTGVAAVVLKKMGVELKAVRDEIERTVERGPQPVSQNQQLPYTPRAKKVLELALEEARNLGHHYIGTEHLLLGLLREHDARRSTASSAPSTSPAVASRAAPLARPRATPPPSTASAATSPSWPARAGSTPSSDARPRSAASLRSSAAAPRTTPSSSARPASARPPSSRASPRTS